MIEALRQQWHDLFPAWAVHAGLADEAFQDLCNHYGEPGRSYHTLIHIQDALRHVEILAAHAQNLQAVKLAAWLHDVIYDPKAADNEERSAEYAMDLCKKLSVVDSALVASLILKTKTHEAGNDPDAQVLIDADLAILGATEATYRAYAEQIRREYAWVPEPEYQTGRTRVLQHFLSKPRIFHWLEDLEEPARRNLREETGRLQASTRP
jgi:predicted metal-dependent HD superfamily phosphohydrolase